jgi:hypothetical protein
MEINEATSSYPLFRGKSKTCPQEQVMGVATRPCLIMSRLGENYPIRNQENCIVKN